MGPNQSLCVNNAKILGKDLVSKMYLLCPLVALAAVCSKVVILVLFFYCKLLLLWYVGVCVWFLFCDIIDSVLS